MHEDLEYVFNRYLSNQNKYPDQIKSQASRLRAFIDFMIQVNQHDSTMTFQTRLEALQLAGTIYNVRQPLEQALKQAGIELDVTSVKAIRAFDKVANYWHISKRLSHLAASSKFRHLFPSSRFRFLTKCAPHVVLRRARFVHAEVQIVTFHRLEWTRPLPRVIGTTKAACYLCNLFLSLHPQYTILATHSTIFDAWSIPDVLPYSVEDRRELRAILQSMQAALEARARKENHGFLQFPVQSGIYHVPSLPSLAGTVIGPAPLVEFGSNSTVRSITKSQNAAAGFTAESNGEAAAMSMSDRDAVSALAATSQRPYGHRAAAKEKYSKDKEVRLIKVVRESHPGRQPQWEAGLKAGTEHPKISAREGPFNRRYDSESKRPQTSYTSSAYIKRPFLRGQHAGTEVKSLQHSDADNGRTSSTYRSKSPLEPMQIQDNAIQERCEGAGQELGGNSSRRSRKRRRRQRRRVKSNPNRRRNDDTSRQLGLSRDKTYRRHGNRAQSGSRSHKRSHQRNSTGKYSFLQSLSRAIRGARRLFCT